MSLLADLPPWYVAALFDPPKIRSVSVGGTAVEVAPANGLRWGLIFSVAPAVAGQIGVLPSSTISTTNAIPISASVLPLIISQDVFGPLVQMQWFGIAGGIGPAITVIELTLLSWPKDPDSKIILPWEEDKRIADAAIAASVREKSTSLRRMLEQCNGHSRRWQSKLTY